MNLKSQTLQDGSLGGIGYLNDDSFIVERIVQFPTYQQQSPRTWTKPCVLILNQKCGENSEEQQNISHGMKSLISSHSSPGLCILV